MYFLGILLISFVGLNSSDKEWKLEKDKDGVKVYTRPHEGSKIKEFRATTILEASLSSAVALVRDAEVTPEWYNHVKSGTPVKIFDEKRSIVHLELDFPFPATDRDIIAKFDYSQDPDTKIVSSVVVGVPDYLPETDGIIRVREIEGSWTFIPLGDNQVQIEYQFFADPGGGLPSWMVNLFIVDDPFKSLKRMQKFVKKEKYQNASFEFIVE